MAAGEVSPPLHIHTQAFICLYAMYVRMCIFRMYVRIYSHAVFYRVHTYVHTFTCTLCSPLVCVVCGFEAFINGKHIVGEVKEKQQAHREYKEAISKGHGAYLMDEDEETPVSVYTVVGKE